MRHSSIPWPLVFATFIIVFSVFLYVANLVVYEALAAIFSLVMPWQLLLLGGLLFLFSGSFVLSSFLGMRFYNWFTRTYYRASSIWIGLFTYLFLASVTYGFLVRVDFALADKCGAPLVVLGVIVSLYGLLHARKIKIKNVQVSLPNLPTVWKGRKAIWISDVHLGQLYGPDFAKKIVDIVNAIPHDIIFIGGDLYDGTGASDITELVAPLGGFSGTLGIYFITGNHEEIGDSSAFVNAVRAAGIRPLLNEVVVIDGVSIAGVDYRDAADRSLFRDILSKFALDPHMPSILLKHEPKDIDITRDAGISFQISGHTHRAQLWPLGYFADFIYKGFAYGLKRSGDTQVFTSSGTGTWGPPMRVGSDSEIVCIEFV